ncbi:hypothetical protein [Nocardia jinanensis]|nr:hypothetical protein [Nocardia jinanensis]
MPANLPAPGAMLRSVSGHPEWVAPSYRLGACLQLTGALLEFA